MENKNLKAKLQALSVGDLVCVEWCDASLGKSSWGGAAVELPVKSWGIYIGLFGEKTKYIVLVQNCFRYATGLFDFDYTAIPSSWAVEISIIAKEYFSQSIVDKLIDSFLTARPPSFGSTGSFIQRGKGRVRSQSRVFMRRLSTHDGSTKESIDS